MEKGLSKQFFLAALVAFFCGSKIFATVLLPFGQYSKQPWEAKYYYSLSTGEVPADDWYEFSFNDSSWGVVQGPIGKSFPYYTTLWESENSTCWIRRRFHLDNVDNSGIYSLYISHDDKCVVYLNGVKIYENNLWNDYNCILPVITFSGDILKEGENVLAVCVVNEGGIGGLDCGISLCDGIYDYELDGPDVELQIENSGENSWTFIDTYMQNGNRGKRNSSSVITMKYKSEEKTEFSFDWLCYNYSSHQPLKLFVDGVLMASTSNSSYTSKRFYLEPGEHVITFKDSIGNSTSTSNYSYIKNVKVREILPLETAVLSENSQPLTFENDGEWPWTIEDGYIQSSNYGTPNSCSKFSTIFTVEEPSKFSFDVWINSAAYDEGHKFEFKINEEKHYQYTNTWNWNSTSTGWMRKKVLLEPGKYTIEFLDSVCFDYEDSRSYICNVELSSDWLEVELASPGTLGVEVLYLVDVLTDVELLKVKGTLNSTDWTNIKQMKNLLGLDLSEAKFNAVPNYAFDGLGSLSSVKLPEGMTSIGGYAFRGTQIWKIDIPSTVTSIGQYAFANTRLSEITFPENSVLNTIGYAAFYQCTSLKEFIMPNTVNTLSTSTDYDYTWYNDIKYFYCRTFYGCSSLQKLHFSDLLSVINYETCYGCTSLTDLKLPANLRSISPYAFGDNYSLSKVDFPKSLTEISNYAFSHCGNLRKVHFAENLRTIRPYAFEYCGIDSLRLPVKLSSLGEYAFRECDNMTYIELPSYIGSYSRNFDNCSAVQKVVCQSATPPAISNDPFVNARSKSAITLVVPSFAVVNYKLDTYWYQFGSITEGDDIDYWKITSVLSLTNNRRMNGKPDIDLYYGGRFTVGGNAPMEVGELNIYVNESNPGRLLNTCEAMTADNVNTYYSVNSETWYFFTPLHDVDLTNVTVSNNASYVFRYYDGDIRANNGTGNSWRNVDNGKLIAGQGYIFRCNTDAVLTMPTGYLKSIASMADEAVWEARVCYTTQNSSDWASTTFDDSSWEIQQAAWGTTDSYSNVETDWSIENSDIYVRRIVNLTADDLEKNLWIRYAKDDDFDLYINGTLILSTIFTGLPFEEYKLSDSEKSLLHVGENVIAAHCHNYGGPGYIDFGLYEKVSVSSGNLDKVLTTKDVIMNLTAYEATVSANKSWNYLGNPYPCYYDIYYMDFTAPITVWTGSTYKAYSIADDNFVLRPMQSFFVQKPDEVDQIIFHKEGRQLTSSIERASYAPNRVSKNKTERFFFDIQIISEDSLLDETRVVLNEAASVNYELAADASKFMSMNVAVPQIFTLDTEGNGYAINERPAADGTIALAYSTHTPAFYTISALHTDGEVWLYDNEANKVVNLVEQDYIFYSENTNGINTTRFVLKLKAEERGGTGIAEQYSEDNVNVIGHQGCLYINAPEGAVYAIYSIDGRKAGQGIVGENNTTIVLPAGTYMVKIADKVFKTIVY